MLAQQQELLAFGLREKLQFHRRTRFVFLSSKDYRSVITARRSAAVFTTSNFTYTGLSVQICTRKSALDATACDAVSVSSESRKNRDRGLAVRASYVAPSRWPTG